MKNQLEFENYILRNGTNVTNKKLQALMFFSLISLCRYGLTKKLNLNVIVKDGYALIEGTFERYQKYGEEVIPVPDKDLHLKVFHEAHLDTILKTYDQFDGKQLKKLVKDTGLLDNCANGYLNKKEYYSYYKSLIKNNLQINRDKDIYQNKYLTDFETTKWTYSSVVLFILLMTLFFLWTKYLGTTIIILIMITVTTFAFASYSRNIHRNIKFVAAMRVEKYKLENPNMEEVQ